MFAKVALLGLLAVASIQAYPSRIVGGHEAAKDAFPYQISLQYGYSLLHSHVCGGSILNSQWILTAGHCITEVPHIPLAHYYVKAGIHNLSDKGQTIKVAQTIVHPNYEGGVNPNDLALIKLEHPLELNDLVKPVGLPAKDAIAEGIATLSGWGSTSGTMVPHMPTILQSMDMPLINYEDCADAFEALAGTSDPLAQTNICTGPLDGGISACSGDSGGPLVTGSGATATQVGIVSWGMMPCGTKGAPSVYTRVSAFIDWINETAK